MLAGSQLLLITDRPGGRGVLGAQLRAWGVEVYEILGGEQALRVLREVGRSGSSPSVALVDLKQAGPLFVQTVWALQPSLPTRLVLLSEERTPLDPELALTLSRPWLHTQLLAQLLVAYGNRRTETLRAPLPLPPSNRSPEPLEGLILLVEDNPVNQKVACRLLARLGYRTDIAVNGVEALAALEQHPYALVLMDCQMPVMDGWTATAEIRRREGSGRHTPIVAMTAAATEEERQSCLRVGMDGYLTKPVNLEELAAVLSQWLPRSAVSLTD